MSTSVTPSERGAGAWPGWRFSGVLPFLVAMYFTTERITIHLPVEREALASVRRGRHRAIAAVVLGAAAGVLGGVGASTVALWVGSLTALGGVGWLVVGPSIPRWRPGEDIGHIELGWVHHRFAAAVLGEDVPAER